MRLVIADDAKDQYDSYDILAISKEKGALLVVAPPYTVFIDSFEELAEAVMELVGQPDLPEPRRQNERSFEDLLAELAGSH